MKWREFMEAVEVTRHIDKKPKDGIMAKTVARKKKTPLWSLGGLSVSRSKLFYPILVFDSSFSLAI